VSSPEELRKTDVLSSGPGYEGVWSSMYLQTCLDFLTCWEPAEAASSGKLGVGMLRTHSESFGDMVVVC
jgi:hypothetical protein